MNTVKEGWQRLLVELKEFTQTGANIMVLNAYTASTDTGWLANLGDFTIVPSSQIPITLWSNPFTEVGTDNTCIAGAPAIWINNSGVDQLVEGFVLEVINLAADDWLVLAVFPLDTPTTFGPGDALSITVGFGVDECPPP